MYTIHRMVRTQLYLDDEAMERLRTLGRQRRQTVSALVREAIEQTYFADAKPPDWESRLDRAVGSWKRPATEPEPEDLVRRMRSAADRSDRWR